MDNIKLTAKKKKKKPRLGWFSLKSAASILNIATNTDLRQYTSLDEPMDSVMRRDRSKLELDYQKALKKFKKQHGS